MREVDFQRLLISKIKGAGGHAFKMSNRFQAGVPDLCAALPMQGGGGALAHDAIPTRLIEVKVLKRLRTGDWEIGLSQLQRAFMKAHQNGGGLAMWLGFNKGLDGDYTIWVGWDPEAVVVQDDDTSKCFVVERGKEWPIRDIIRG